MNPSWKSTGSVYSGFTVTLTVLQIFFFFAHEKWSGCTCRHRWGRVKGCWGVPIKNDSQGSSKYKFSGHEGGFSNEFFFLSNIYLRWGHVLNHYIFWNISTRTCTYSMFCTSQKRYIYIYIWLYLSAYFSLLWIIGSVRCIFNSGTSFMLQPFIFQVWDWHWACAGLYTLPVTGVDAPNRDANPGFRGESATCWPLAHQGTNIPSV